MLFEMAGKVKCEAGTRQNCPYMGESCSSSSERIFFGEVSVGEDLYKTVAMISIGHKIWIDSNTLCVCEPGGVEIGERYSRLELSEIREEIDRVLSDAKKKISGLFDLK
jgi:hypothetical protein